MGYYRPLTVTRYTFPSSEGAALEDSYWFDWKTFVTYGETKTVSKRIADEAKAAGIKPEDIAADTANAALAISYIAAWNVTDEQGVLLPLVPESIDKLQDIDAGAIMDLLRERVNAKATERKN